MKTYISILLVWIGIIAFTGNILKIYDSTSSVLISEESGEMDDDNEEEKVKESEEYLREPQFFFTAPNDQSINQLSYLHHYSIRQGYSSPLIKPPLY